MNIYEPRIMLKALRLNPSPKRFLLKTFFPGIERHTTKSVEMDIQKTRRKMAEFTHPASSARLVERDGYYTMTVEPAYIKEKIPLRPVDLTHRQMGETPYDNTSPADRALQQLGTDQRTLDERLVRREELMCAEALLTGKIEVKGEGFNEVVDFGYVPGEHSIVLSGTSAWNHADGDPGTDLKRWKTSINQRGGVRPNRVIVGSKVAEAIMDNPKVAKRLDNRRMELGKIDPKEMPEGVDYLGYLAPSMIDIYTYEEWYVASDGNEYPIIPEDAVIIGSTEAGNKMHYGLIQNLKCMAALDRFSFTYEENDGSAKFLQMESAPMPCIYNPNAFMVARVLN